jgi:hypothetical protein
MWAEPTARMREEVLDAQQQIGVPGTVRIGGQCLCKGGGSIHALPEAVRGSPPGEGAAARGAMMRNIEQQWALIGSPPSFVA